MVWLVVVKLVRLVKVSKVVPVVAVVVGVLLVVAAVLVVLVVELVGLSCAQLRLRPAQLLPPDDTGRAAYARAHAFFEECVSEVEVCWLGRAQLVHFAPPMAASHLPPSFEEELLRALLRHATPQQRAAELLLQQARCDPM